MHEWCVDIYIGDEFRRFVVQARDSAIAVRKAWVNVAIELSDINGRVDIQVQRLGTSASKK